MTLEDGVTIHNAFPDRNFDEGPEMKLHYYPETDSLYIELSDGTGVEVREIADGLNADLDASGRVIGLDIEHASTHLRFDQAGNGVVAAYALEGGVDRVSLS